MRGLSDTAKVGAVVILVVLLLAGMMQLIQRNVYKVGAYTVYVNFENGMGLQNDMPLKMGGLDAGWVDDSTRAKLPDGNFTTRARISVKKSIDLYKNAKFTISQEGLIGEKFLGVDGGNDEVEMASKEPGQLVLKLFTVDLANNAVNIKGDYATCFSKGDTVNIVGATRNRDEYKVTSNASFISTSGLTIIPLNKQLDDPSNGGDITKKLVARIAGVNLNDNTVDLAGNLTSCYRRGDIVAVSGLDRGFRDFFKPHDNKFTIANDPAYITPPGITRVALEEELPDAPKVNSKFAKVADVFTGSTQADIAQLVDNITGVVQTMQGLFSEVMVKVARIDAQKNAIEVDGRYADRFFPGDLVDITGSTGNNGRYVVAAAATYDPQRDRTSIPVKETLPTSMGGGNLSKEAMGSVIAQLSNNLTSSLDKVGSLLSKTNEIVGGSQGSIVASMKNIKAMSDNFLSMSKNLNDISVSVAKVANDPRYTEMINNVTDNLDKVSANLNSLSTELNALASDPQVKQDIKDSIHITKETLEGARDTVKQFQKTLDKANGMIDSAGGLIDNANGAVGQARDKLDKFSSVGQAIDVQAGLDMRVVDADRNHRPGANDKYVADINMGAGYKNLYVTGGADNVGGHGQGNLLVGFGKLNEGASLRGGIYRGQLGGGAAYFLPGGGGISAMLYDARDPKLNAFGYLPVGNAVEVVMGMEDIEHHPQATVGVGVKLKNGKKK